MLSKIFSNQNILSRISYCPSRFFASAVANNVAATAIPKPKVPKVKKTKEVPPPVPEKKPKHKTPFRRASKLLHDLNQEAYKELRAGRRFPEMRAGDLVEVYQFPYITAKEAVKFRGILIAKSNKGAETRVRILSVEHGTELVRTFPLYSPLVKSVKIVFKAWIHRGKKKVRRSRIYYLERRDPKEYTIDEEQLQELLAEKKAEAALAKEKRKKEARREEHRRNVEAKRARLAQQEKEKAKAEREKAKAEKEKATASNDQA